VRAVSGAIVSSHDPTIGSARSQTLFMIRSDNKAQLPGYGAGIK